MSRRVYPILMLFITLGIACSANDSAGGDEASPAVMQGKVGARERAPEASAMTRDESDSRAAPVGFAADASGLNMPIGGAAQRSDSVAPSMIIRTGHASVKVDSLEPAIAAVRALATRLGGWVGNTSLSSGDDLVRSATIELKIPAPRYEEALTSLRPIGKVETVSSNAEDVGEQFVDISARVANARRLEERLVTLLATRTGKLEDVLAVERELARVREEIERYDGRLRFLRTRTAVSTLTVTVHEPAPLVGVNPGENIIGEAFREMWRNFVRFVAAFIASLGTLVPLAIIIAAAALAWRRFGPRIGRRAAPPVVAPAPPDAG